MRWSSKFLCLTSKFAALNWASIQKIVQKLYVNWQGGMWNYLTSAYMRKARIVRHSLSLLILHQAKENLGQFLQELFNHWGCFRGTQKLGVQNSIRHDNDVFWLSCIHPKATIETNSQLKWNSFAHGIEHDVFGIQQTADKEGVILLAKQWWQTWSTSARSDKVHI